MQSGQPVRIFKGAQAITGNWVYSGPSVTCPNKCLVESTDQQQPLLVYRRFVEPLEDTQPPEIDPEIAESLWKLLNYVQTTSKNTKGGNA